ncbi:HlyD family secretion protein [Microbulbifer sp. S227A]|uniref:HlyD family secretion protein n=1 Tax=Microbulbifer sp. S227A TaxID=3415131 RepID=UPI003C7E932F
MNRKILLLGALGAAIVAAGVLINRPESARAVQSTTDAYLQADFTNVAPRVSGTVTEVLVRENQQVRAGDVLAELDKRDQLIAVQTAQAALDAARANLRVLESQQRIQASIIEQSDAAIEAGEATLNLAVTEEQRTRQLFEKNSVPQRTLDEAVTDLANARAALHSDRASHEAARQQLAVFDAQIEAARASVAQASAQLDQSRLVLSYLTITAPIPGRISQMNLRVGAYAAAGATLTAIVPLQDIYIEARFREGQLARVAPGQPVEVTVDGLPGMRFTGRVDSVGAASGATFSPVAAQNATGNFTKVAQRLPVRIALDPGQPGMDAMRVGMSVVPEITVTN